MPLTSANDQLRGISTPEELFATLRARDVSGLTSRLNSGGLHRIATGKLTVSEMLVSAEWLGMPEPEEIFRGTRAVH